VELGGIDDVEKTGLAGLDGILAGLNKSKALEFV